MQDYEALRIVENLIDAWIQNSELRHLAKALKKQKNRIIPQVAELLRSGEIRRDRIPDRVRAFILAQLPASMKLDLKVEHFVMFKKLRTAEFVLEGAFGFSLDNEAGSVEFPYVAEVSVMVARCLHPLTERDVVTFITLFSGRTELAHPIDQDKSMRYRSMIWFAYLLIDMFRIDPQNMCKGNVTYMKLKLRELMDKTMGEEIIDEEDHRHDRAFEGGRWADTLFGWLQGEDNRPFLVKLRRQFNLENKVEHGNRMLLAKHRECMYRQAVALFCHGEAPAGTGYRQ